jgi:5'-nucleotidase
MEAALMGFPAIAFSLDAQVFTVDALTRSAAVVDYIVRIVLSAGLPPGTFLNVNIPNSPIRGICLTSQGKRHYGEGIVHKTDPRGRSYYWIGGNSSGFEDIPGSDCNAIAAGQVSITPLRTGFTSESALKLLADWPLSFAMD